jgi:hypothetical protein
MQTFEQVFLLGRSNRQKNRRVKNKFWSHASQRAECRDFGDVITFDTTHKTNKHRMLLAMFVGLNHQLQNAVFGQALLRDESSESFEWLFLTFKTCMGGPDPHVLLTGEHCQNCVHDLHVPYL